MRINYICFWQQQAVPRKTFALPPGPTRAPPKHATDFCTAYSKKPAKEQVKKGGIKSWQKNTPKKHTAIYTTHTHPCPRHTPTTHTFCTSKIWTEALKLRCDERFTHAFTACSCVFIEITLVGSNQGNYFESATACSIRMRKTLIATQL